MNQRAEAKFKDAEGLHQEAMEELRTDKEIDKELIGRYHTRADFLHGHREWGKR